MRTLLREPVLHFVLIAAAIFAFDASQSGRADRRPQGQRIDITRGDIDHLRQIYQLQFQRPPTRGELDGLVAGEVRERVFYQEALALGLDRDDVIVRRRLAQKLEFMTQGVLEAQQPTETQLIAYFARHPSRYQLAARVSFEHVYFNPDRRPLAEEEARAALAQLRRRAVEPVNVGDPSLLEPDVHDESLRDVEQRFGPDFARAVQALAEGSWQGPVRSSFGWHLVKVGSRTAARMPALAAVREEVRKDCADEMRRQSNEELFARLKARYEIAIADVEPRTSAVDRGPQSRETVQ